MIDARRFAGRPLRRILVSLSLMLLTSAPAPAVTTFDDDVTPDVIFGAGNSNGGFTVDRDGGVELGLRAKIPFTGVIHSNGDGTYSYTLAELLAADPSQRWNFDWTVNTDYLDASGDKIDDLTYLLELDFDPGPGTDFLAFDPITPTVATPFFDHSIGDNTTANGGGAEAGDAPTYTALIASNNVAQQSWRHAFFNPPPAPLPSYDPTIPGVYDVVLSAFDAGSSLVASVSIQVIIDGKINTSNLSENGWFSDDTRADGTGTEAAGTNLISDTLTDDPEATASGTPAHDGDIRGQISFGAAVGTVPAGTNSLAVHLQIANTPAGKSQITHRKDDGVGHAAGSVFGPGFSAVYSWMGDGTPSVTASLKFGIKTAEFGSTGISSRTGENVWDKVLIYEPGNLNGGVSDGTWQTETLSHSSGKWWFFDRTAGASIIGTPMTLQDMAGALGASTLVGGGPKTAQDVYNLITAAGAHITSVQFGIGSGNANGSVYINQLVTNFYRAGSITTFGGCGDRYVDVTGSDTSNNCLLPGLPCATVQHAIDEACPGEIVNVAAGTYAEPAIHVTTPVTIIGDDPTTTFIETTTGGAAVFIDVDDVTVRDLTIQPGSGTQGIRFELAGMTIDNTEINNVHILDHSSNGMELHNATTVTNLRVIDCTITGNSTGIRMASASTVDGLTVTGSTFDNANLGIYQANDGGSSTLNDLEVRDCTFTGHGDTPVFAEEITNSIIEDNDFFDNERGVTLFKEYAGAGHPDVENLIIRGNTFTDNEDASVIVWVRNSGLAGTGVTVENNTTNQDAGLMDTNWAVIDVRLDTGFMQAPVTIQGNTVIYSGTFVGGGGATAAYGVKARGALGSVTVTGNVLDGGGVVDDGGVPQNSGVYVQTDDGTFGPVTGTIDLNCNRIVDWQNGISVYDAEGATFGGLPVGAGITAHDNSISGSSGAGIDNSGTSETVDAEDNWWGAADGPSGVGPGSGDAITANVDADPFSTSVPACVNCTSDAECSDGLTCTGAETCNLTTNMCEAGTPIVCPISECETGVCLEPSGACELELDGTVCSATPDMCSLDDTCLAGVCVDGGGGDMDGDNVCDADDNCPEDSNTGQEDFDNDGLGDVCDDNDLAGLSLRKIKLRDGDPGKQRYNVKGEVDATLTPNFINDADANGLTFILETTTPPAEIDTFSFTGADCVSTNGVKIKCRDPESRSTLRLSKRPAPLFFRVSLAVKNATFTLPTLAEEPLVVRLQTADFLDRRDDIDSCESKAKGKVLKCVDKP